MTKIFCLHGWSYSTNKWQPFLEQLKDTKLHPVLLPIPGLTEKLDMVWTLDDYISWLKGKLDQEKNVILLGHSNGGRIALAFAAKYPQKVTQLILIDSAGIYHNELPLRIKRAVFKIMAGVGKRLTTSNTLRNLLYKLAREQDYQNATPIQRQTMANLISQDLTPILSQIQQPTLIIWGKQDRITPLADSQVMHTHLKKSQLFVIEGARHSPHFTHPEEVARIIHEHI